MTILRNFAITLSLLVVSITAQADAYRFEVILFERPGGGTSESWPETTEGLPETAGHTPLRAMAVGNLGLASQADALDRRGMSILGHFAWVQTPQGLGNTRWYTIDEGRLSGLVRVQRGRFLHLETDLVLRDAVTGQPYHVRHKRRMRSGELHYVDHPKVGILIRASKVEDSPATPGDATGDGSAGT
jgi:hypothetical protein